MWVGWPLSRVVLLLTGLAFLLIFIQVTLFHYRQNFRHIAMWVPVLALPLLGLFSLALATYLCAWIRTTTALLLAVGALAGLYGFILHFRGVGQRVDGYKMQNFLVGPPVILPLMISAIAVLGLLAIYWRR